MDDDVTPTTARPAPAPLRAEPLTVTEPTSHHLPTDQIIHHLGRDAMIYPLDDGTSLVLVPNGPES
jgi:hypothetical protein